MIKTTVQIGSPEVRAKSKPVLLKEIKSKRIKNLIRDLVDSMRHYNLVGMAAPQIGINLNVFVTEVRKTNLRKSTDKKDSLRVFINPTILKKSAQKKDMFEGCGSVAFGKLHGPVKRHLSVVVEALDEHGEPFKLEAKGLLGHIVQHEYDHLQGVLCIDKFSDTRKLVFYGKDPYANK